jgi:hypothetical protein
MRTRGFAFVFLLLAAICSNAQIDNLREGFHHPPDSTRPWVYWMWMDGNLSREGITADLESMKKAGIGGVIICEVNVDVPRGSVDFMSPEWRRLFKHVVNEAERLGLQITLNAGPGWTGSGGPWVKPEQSMQHIVASDTDVTGPALFDGILPRPVRRPAFFGDGHLPPDQEKAKDDYYQDVAVLAFRALSGNQRIVDIDEKALYVRAPYSSQPNVKPYLPMHADYPDVPADDIIEQPRVIDITGRLAFDGSIVWNVPPGRWSIMRFGRTSTGANTRPAPLPGLGLECDKLDTAALNAHFQEFVGALLQELGPLDSNRTSGWTMLHIDSWEMGAQNWTGMFREEFRKRRGYDLLPYLPAVSGRIIDSREISERFLWDLRQTANELVLEHHATHLKELGRRNGFRLSIEPYDMTPCSDMSLGSIADVPMAEFWLYGFNTSFSVIEATSIAHTCGRPVVAAEAFTSSDQERWQAYPGMMKAIGDWAFCAGINRFAFHRYQHQPWADVRPGMTMGPYGVHWERTQTWWNMVPAYHEYLSRCQLMLRRGLPVAEVCYLVAEGAPQVFRPPSSAMRGNPPLPVRSPSANDPSRTTGRPDRLGYNFDGIAPDVLMARMSVKEGRLVLPDGMSYSVLALPERETMTPQLLRKIHGLVEAGATVIGPPPRKSPSLSAYPACDHEVQTLARELWGEIDGHDVTEHHFGQGRTVWHRPAITQLGTDAVAQEALKRAFWIWADGMGTSAPHRPAHCYFYRDFTIQKTQKVISAFAHITADHGFTLWVNGQRVGESEDSSAIYAFDIGYLLQPGLNRVALEIANADTPPDTAGVLATIVVGFDDSTSFESGTNKSWMTRTWAKPGWSATTDSSKGWVAARVLGSFDAAPWKSRMKSAFIPEQYGDFQVIENVLEGMHLIPDFATDAPIRYTHRREGDRDIYFVANGEGHPISARCTFRVMGKQPELWDAVRGETRALSRFSQGGGRTTIDLEFAPYQSFFVVFGGHAHATENGLVDFPATREVVTIPGPWKVSFDPKWGGPREVTFAQLEDWTRRKEKGIKYYSGSATYRTSFALPLPQRAHSGGKDSSPSRLWLNLGTVYDLASVTLNGRDLGVVWCAPWRIDITDALQSKENTLEITVANLWPNRLIGDEQLRPDCTYGKWGNLVRWPDWFVQNRKRPVAGRYTFTTWKHFTRRSVLLPSGLLGPVIVSEE